MVDTIYKFGWIPKEECRYEYANAFAVERTSGPERLIIAPSSNHLSIMIDLLQVMNEPFWILYILTVPRGGSEAGRYQSADPLFPQQAEEFLVRFGQFLENDGRHHVWVKSVSGSDLLVYDKHNVLYAYGQLAKFEAVLSNRGLEKVESIQFPSPHTHQYNASFDQDERDVVRYWKWKLSQLQDSDE